MSKISQFGNKLETSQPEKTYFYTFLPIYGSIIIEILQ